MEKVYTINEIKRKLNPIFKDYPVYKAVLFGSYAKGSATSKSDLDVVLDSHGEIRGLSFYGVLDDISSALDKKIDMFDASEIKQKSPLMEEINKQGVILYERER